MARERLGPGKVLAVEQAVVLTDDREEALARAHAHLDIYTGLPNYRNSWSRQGFDETDFVRGGSDRLAEALVVWGEEATITARVAEHFAAGADHVCIQALGADVFTVPDDQWRRLAPALTELA
jgi:probable F420-dependent oxidoreductase